MLFCRKCGAKLPDDSAFCGKCGTAVVTEVQEEAEELSPQAETEPAKISLSKGVRSTSPKRGTVKRNTNVEAQAETPSAAVADQVRSEDVDVSQHVARPKSEPVQIKRFFADRSVYTFAAKYFAVVAGLLAVAAIGVFGYCASNDCSIDEEINSYHLVIDTHLLSGYGLPYDAAETSSVASARNRALTLVSGESGASASESGHSDTAETKK